MSTVIPRFSIKQGATRPTLIGTLFQGPNLQDLTSASTAQINVSNDAGSLVVTLGSCTILTPLTGGEVSYNLTSAITANPGKYLGEIKVTYNDASVEYFPDDGYFEIIVTANLGA